MAALPSPPDAKKPLATTNISNKLHNQSTNDMVKLGRKDLRPRVKETNDQDKKTIEHRTDEEVDESEAEELVQDHDTQDINHKGVGEIENAGGGEESKEDGMGKNTEKINVEMQGHERENGDKGRQRSGVKDEITKTEGEREREGMKQSQHEGKDEATKEVSGKEQGTKGSGMGEKGNTKENLKESTSEGSKNESRDRKEDNKEEGDVKQSEEERERKDDKQSEEIKGQVNQNMSNEQNKVVVVEKEEGTENEGGNLNPKEIEISSPSEDNVSSDSRMNENKGENGTGEDGTSSSKGPSMDKSDSGSNSNVPRASSEKKGQGDAISTIKSYQNRKIGKQTAEQINKKASPDTYLVPAFEHKAAVSVNSTGNQKNGESNQNGAKNESYLSNKNGPKADIPQEKDAQVTLPRGSRKHENAAAAQ